MSANEKKYRAFISYSHQDRRWGEWLHRSLETYRVPPRLVGRQTAMGEVPRRIRPVFRDREELPTATELGDVINRALANSACLIVVCSPRSARSRWVNEEILTYKRLGRSDRILCLIVDGEPNASDKPGLGAEECFPKALKYRLAEGGELGDIRTEPVAADARTRGDGKRNAMLKLVAGVLGVGYDELRQRDQQRRQKRLAWLSAAALAGVTLTSGLAVNAWLAQQEAVRERERAEMEAQTARRTTDFLVSLFAVSDPGEARGNSITARELLDQGAERIEAELADEPEVRLRLMQTIGAVYRSLGLYEPARRMLSEALESAPTVYGEQDLRTASLKEELAYLYNLDGSDIETAERLMQEGLATRRAAADSDPLDLTRVMNGLAFGWIKAGRKAEEAAALLEEALAIQRAHLDPPDPQLAETLFHLGWANNASGDRDTGRRYYEQALAMRRELYGDTHPSLGWSLNNLGHLEIGAGEPEKGKAYCEEALAINRRLFDGLHNEQGFNLRCIAMAEQEMGNLQAALLAAEESVRILRETLQPDAPELGENLGRLADIHGNLGHFETSLALRREEVGVFEAGGAIARARLGGAVNNLAYQESMVGNYAAARDRYAQAVEILRAEHGDGHRRLVIPLSNLAASMVSTDDVAAAEAPIREAARIARAVDMQPPWVLHVLDLNLGEILTRLGRFEEACELTGSAIRGLEETLDPEHYRVGMAQNVHGYCMALAGRSPVEAMALLEQGLERILATRPRGESRRIEAMERIVEVAQRLGDEERERRYGAMIDEERAAAASG